jgi:hypothetical protein
MTLGPEENHGRSLQSGYLVSYLRFKLDISQPPEATTLVSIFKKIPYHN